MKPTDTRRVGKTDLSLPILGVGCNPLGGMYEPVPSQQVKAIVDRAFARDLSFFDLAPVYGYGNAERNVGAALQGRNRDNIIVTTKVGRLLLDPNDPATPTEREDVMVLWEGEQLYKGTDPVRPYFDFTYDGVMRSVDDSLTRMKLDRVDALHIHDPDLHPDEALEGAFKALSDLKSDGTIGAVGCGMNQWEMLADFADRAPFDCFLLAGRYSLLDQSAMGGLMTKCAEKDISLVIGGVYNSGILSHPDPGSISGVSSDKSAIGSWAANVTFNYIPAGEEIIDKAAAIKRVCDGHDVSLMAAAIQFPLHHPAVASVLMGPRTPEHVDSNVDAFEEAIPDGLWADLKSEGHLPGDVPVPGE